MSFTSRKIKFEQYSVAKQIIIIIRKAKFGQKKHFLKEGRKGGKLMRELN